MTYKINKATFNTKYYDLEVAYTNDTTKRSYAGNRSVSPRLIELRSKLAGLIRDYYGLNDRWSIKLHSINYNTKNLKTSLILENDEIYPPKKGCFNFGIEYGANPTIGEVEIQQCYEDLKKELIRYVEDVEAVRV